MDKDEIKKPKEKPKTELQKVDMEWLERNQKMGMSSIDKSEIPPGEIRIMQKTSKLETFIGLDGKTPQIGNFVYTGTMKEMESFEAYVVYIKKGTYLEIGKEEEGEKIKFQTLGLMTDTEMPFIMQYKSTAIRSLNKLMSVSYDKKRPIWSFRIKFETRFIQGKVNEWYIPIMREIIDETDEGKLRYLKGVAERFELLGGPGEGNTDDEDESEYDRAMNKAKELSQMEKGGEQSEQG